MSFSHLETVNSYNKAVDAYVAKTPHQVDGDLEAWLNACVHSMGKDENILEIGSGFGRDATYLISEGYFSVTCSEASIAFFPFLEKIGCPVIELDVVNKEIPGVWDLILANAVLLHFEREVFPEVLVKIISALVPGGRFGFTVKKGEGSEWSEEKLNEPRFFQYWQKDDVLLELEKAGFRKVLFFKETELWLHFVVEA